MSPQRATAADYASGIFQAALGSWLDSLNQALSRLNKDRVLAGMLNDPGQSLETKLAQVNSLLPANAPPSVHNVVSTLIANGDIGMLTDVVGELTRMGSRQERGPVAATITSAVPLTANETAQLETKLKEQFGDHLQFTYEIDPTILGGLIVRAGDKLIDSSVRSRLNALREQLGVTAS